MYMKDPFAFMEYIFELGFTTFSHMGYQLIWLESSENLSIQNFIRNNVVCTFTVALNCLLKKQQCGIKKVLIRGRRYGKTRVASWKLKSTSSNSRVRVQIHEFKSTSYEFKTTSYKFKSMSYEFKSTSHKFNFTSYEFQSTSHEFKSTRLKINESMKTQVNSLKISSFPKILSLKSFGNSWGNLSVQFLVIISCFIFPLFHGYGFNRNSVNKY